ncbi:hypothetical protein FVR03_17625 [Pontibacter qinzhouensis]|uniref:Uncharacterized protein n=1 Tax=Pontibacter qinzhouensis TaxID=2603253 RepID=A0A5C8JIU1_9BACT|nr:hypothetical protein [Pontibacter qinzhouensis]TXK36477.1 hypothetical protein FVR03_17625 [Pontibacter qinzhouensis]
MISVNRFEVKCAVVCITLLFFLSITYSFYYKYGQVKPADKIESELVLEKTSEEGKFKHPHISFQAMLRYAFIGFEKPVLFQQQRSHLDYKSKNKLYLLFQQLKVHLA